MLKSCNWFPPFSKGLYQLENECFAIVYLTLEPLFEVVSHDMLPVPEDTAKFQYSPIRMCTNHRNIQAVYLDFGGI